MELIGQYDQPDNEDIPHILSAQVLTFTLECGQRHRALTAHRQQLVCSSLSTYYAWPGGQFSKCLLTSARHHTCKRMWPLVQDAKQHLQANGPWRYVLSAFYSIVEVTAAIQVLRAAETLQEALSYFAA